MHITKKEINYAQELKIAIDAAMHVGRFQLDNQHRVCKTIKKDNSPVTDIDVASEEIIKERILSSFPHDGFFGEETKEVQGKNGRQWIVDPLDGTRPYIRQIPTFSTLIALEEDGDIVVAVANFPALKETYYSAKGSGAYCNNRRIVVSNEVELCNGMGACAGLIEETSSLSNKLIRLMRSADYAYGFMDAYSYMSVACGRLDFCISTIDEAWDRAAATLIVTEAGGDFGDFLGHSRYDGKTFYVSNGSLKSQLLNMLWSDKNESDSY